MAGAGLPQSVPTANMWHSYRRRRTSSPTTAISWRTFLSPIGRAFRSSWSAARRRSVRGDGRYIAFQSEASDLKCTVRCAKAMEDINLLSDVFLYDRQTQSINRISADDRGAWMEPSVAPALDAMARVVVFSSRHPMNATDRRNDFDLFIVTR